MPQIPVCHVLCWVFEAFWRLQNSKIKSSTICSSFNLNFIGWINVLDESWIPSRSDGEVSPGFFHRLPPLLEFCRRPQSFCRGSLKYCSRAAPAERLAYAPAFKLQPAESRQVQLQSSAPTLNRCRSGWAVRHLQGGGEGGRDLCAASMNTTVVRHRFESESY